ncbi:MAG: ASCH domain-containing protein [Archaeoglobaceae archaeon]
MERINFDPEYVPLILEGRKRTTVRKGIKSYPVGRIVELTVENSRVFALARVNKVVVKRVSELSDEDARLDGFESREELIRALRRIYGEVKDGDFVTVVHFEVVKHV